MRCAPLSEVCPTLLRCAPLRGMPHSLRCAPLTEVCTSQRCAPLTEVCTFQRCVPLTEVYLLHSTQSLRGVPHSLRCVPLGTPLEQCCHPWKCSQQPEVCPLVGMPQSLKGVTLGVPHSLRCAPPIEVCPLTSSAWGSTATLTEVYPTH